MFSIVENKRPDRLVFHIKNVDLSIVNSLRRIGLSQIPNVSLDFDMEHPDYEDEKSPKIRVNTSALHNELLLQRLSLVPYCFDSKEIEEFESSKYRFRLAKKNTTNKIISVTTNDIEVVDADRKVYTNEFHSRIFPKNAKTGDSILIVKLKEDEEIDVEWELTKGIAEQHARWCPVSQCTFSYVSDYKSVNTSQMSLLNIQRNFVKDKWGEPALFEFKIESECALSPHYIFAKSIDVLKDKIENIGGKLKYEKVEGSSMINVHINGEDVTVANVLQSCIYNRVFRDGSRKELEFIGYYQPHPLVKHAVLKLKPASSTVDIEKFMAEQCALIVSDLENIKSEWEKISVK